MKKFKDIILESKEYDLGYRAGVSGVEYKQNPYKINSVKYKQWLKGYDDGIRDNEQ